VHTLRDLLTLEGLLGRPVTDDDLEHDNLVFAHLGRSVMAVDYASCLEAQHAWGRRMLSWWHPDDGSHGFDLLLTPVIASPPPPIGYLSAPEGGRRVAELMLFTAQFNVTGQPAISVPTHVSAGGLPIGSHLVASYGREDVLVRVAAQLESAAPWPTLAPR